MCIHHQTTSSPPPSASHAPPCSHAYDRLPCLSALQALQTWPYPLIIHAQWQLFFSCIRQKVASDRTCCVLVVRASFGLLVYKYAGRNLFHDNLSLATTTPSTTASTYHTHNRLPPQQSETLAPSSGVLVSTRSKTTSTTAQGTHVSLPSSTYGLCVVLPPHGVWRHHRCPIY